MERAPAGDRLRATNPDAVIHLEHSEYRGIDAIEEVQAHLLEIFQDVRAEIESLVTEGNSAVMKVQFQATIVRITPASRRLESPSSSMSSTG